VRFYPGCTGLKTGSTSKAGFCVSVTAARDGFSLICVVMGAESRDVRNAIATELLDWGFANYGLYQAPAAELAPLAVIGGAEDICELSAAPFSCVLPKNLIGGVEQKITLPESVTAPVKLGDEIGTIEYLAGGKTVGSVPIVANSEVPKIDFFEILKRMIARFLLI
jgi:D-alanyl-D-alanine carboxypeptidase (penicillin-binding protein 5/6)